MLISFSIYYANAHFKANIEWLCILMRWLCSMARLSIFHFNDNMHTLASKSLYNRLKHDVLFGKKITCVILEKLLFIFWLWLVAHSVRRDVLLLTNWFSFYLYKLFSLDFPIKHLMYGFFRQSFCVLAFFLLW